MPTHDEPVVNPKARDHPAGADCGLAALPRGAVAGLGGAAAMSVSTNLEMRLRNRPPSYAPAKALGRMLGIDADSDQTEKLLGLLGHVGTAVSLGTVRGLLDRAGLGPGSSGFALFVLAMAPEVIAVPALGAADPPWRWSRTEAALSVLHHAVFAAGTTVAYERLRAHAQ